MPLDAYHLFAVTRELNMKLQNGRIDKITMPAPCDVLIHIRAQGNNFRLMISANPAKPRLWLTPLDYVNPAVAPAYCMHLRKYLLGGKILSVTSSPYERVVKIEILAHSEIGDERVMTLVVEIMGRYSNILLLDGEKITDCLKHTPLGTETAHPALPNLSYAPNIQSDKFYADDEVKLHQLLSEYRGGDVCTYLLTGLAGFAALTLKQILSECPLSTPPLDVEIRGIILALRSAYKKLSVGDYAANVIIKNGNISDFAVLDYSGEYRRVDSILTAMSEYYSVVDSSAMWTSAVSAPKNAVNAEIKKLEKRIAALKEKIQESVESDKYRINGELLTANLYQIPARAKNFVADNWYDGTKTDIQLDPTKTPVQNANQYFKKYNKLKRAADIAVTLENEARERLNYLESIRASFEFCTTYDDVEGVKRELVSAGLMCRAQTKAKLPPVKNKPVTIDCDGFEIIIGKNNLQNEEITFKIAKKTDTWLHALHAHGSHVLVKNPTAAELPDKVLIRAAQLAAHYSSARASDKVEVDYCLMKYVTRNAVKGIGNVTYTHQRSLVVKPSA